MKKRLFTLCASLVLICSLSVVAYAGYTPIIGATETAYWLGQNLNASGHTIVDVGPNAASFDYKVTVGYGSLSDICAEANGIGITCSLYYNTSQKVYVIRVHDRKAFGLINTYGLIANPNGYVYTAEPESTAPITSPDITITVPVTPTITFDDTNIVNAVESLYDQLTWVIRCQFEQMQDTLVNGRILLNINDLISKNVIPYLEDILVANTAASSTLQAFYHSFESKFSDLDSMFGTDTSMVVHNGDRLTWDSTTRGFTSAVADGTANTIRLTPTTTLTGYNISWSSDGYFTITPAGGGVFPDTLNVGTGTVTMPVVQTSETVTVTNPALNEYVPDGYTQYETFLPSGYGPLDLGVVPVSGMQIDSSLTVFATATDPVQPQYFFGVDGLSMAISQNQKAIEIKSGTALYSYAKDFTNGRGISFHFYWELGNSWRDGLDLTRRSLSSFPSTNKTLQIGGANGISNLVPNPGHASKPHYSYSQWGPITIKDSSENLLYVFVPCKRNSDGASGLYRVNYNAGVYSGGSFIACQCGLSTCNADHHLSNELPLTVETTVTKPGNIVRIYRDSGNFWYAVGSDGTVQNFDAISSVALLKAFPVYEYRSVDAISSLPDGTYTITWSGTAQTVTINYQAYSKFFAYIANQIAYNRNWLDARLDQLSFSTGDVTVSPTDLTPVITSVDAVGLNIENLNANFNANIGSLLDKLDIVIEGTSESVENRINVTIDASNDAYNVFYITGEDGETQSVTEFTGDLTKASGRLLSLLYRLVFADTLSGVDGDLDGFEDFFTSQGDETATQSMESPYEEENVWLAS